MNNPAVVFLDVVEGRQALSVEHLDEMLNAQLQTQREGAKGLEPQEQDAWNKWVEQIEAAARDIKERGFHRLAFPLAGVIEPYERELRRLGFPIPDPKRKSKK